jgi:hypothetical protein
MARSSHGSLPAPGAGHLPARGLSSLFCGPQLPSTPGFQTGKGRLSRPGASVGPRRGQAPVFLDAGAILGTSSSSFCRTRDQTPGGPSGPLQARPPGGKEGDPTPSAIRRATPVWMVATVPVRALDQMAGAPSIGARCRGANPPTSRTGRPATVQTAYRRSAVSGRSRGRRREIDVHHEVVAAPAPRPRPEGLKVPSRAATRPPAVATGRPPVRS